MITAGMAGLGFIWVHQSSVAKKLKQGKLIEIFPEHALRKQAMYLYYLNGQYIHPKIRAFVDFFSNP
jgi:DNA-binding transcriptional LysR family regulator